MYLSNIITHCKTVTTSGKYVRWHELRVFADVREAATGVLVSLACSKRVQANSARHVLLHSHASLQHEGEVELRARKIIGGSKRVQPRCF